MNVLFVPGLMGTELTGDFYIVNRKIWLNYAAMAADGAWDLMLNYAGDGPAPQIPIKRWIIGQPLAEYYGPLMGAIARAHDLRTFGYDWRMSIKALAGQLADRILFLTGGTGSTNVVAHSMGGLVARGAWKVLAGQGKASCISKLITLGTPHFGSLSSVRAWGRIEPTYQRIVALVSVLRGLNFVQAARIVDVLLVGFPSIYEMMPFKNSGPIAGDRVLAEALYQRSSYMPFASIRQDRLDNAVAVQGWLADAGFPAQTTVIQGTGLTTPTAILYEGQLLGTPLGYSYGLDGDSTVAAAFGTWPNAAATIYLPGIAHSLMCVDSRAISACLSALA